MAAVEISRRLSLHGFSTRGRYDIEQMSEHGFFSMDKIFLGFVLNLGEVDDNADDDE